MFDVTSGRQFYGADGPYHALAACDASRLLAKGRLEPESEEEVRVPLTQAELETLRDWHAHYCDSYRKLAPLRTAPVSSALHEVWRHVE